MILTGGSITDGILTVAQQRETLEPILLDVELTVEEYDLEVGDDSSFDCDLGTAIVINQIVGDEYEGPYEFTPSGETQTVEISLKTATQDITINPIPSNYGLITWDGSVLTVS